MKATKINNRTVKSRQLLKLTPCFLLPLGTGLIVLCFLFFSSCNNLSTPTQGKQKIFIDESYQPLLDAEIEVFEGLYKNSDIEPVYKPERDVINDFLNDTCRIIVMGRDLNQKEKDFFTSKKLSPVSTKIAVDALAFITNKSNPLVNLTFNELEDIFSGKTNNWKLLDSSIPARTTVQSGGKDKSPQDTSITIVFDNEKSCNVRLVKEKLLNGGSFPANCFALKTNPEVIDYVSKNKNTIGIIGVNWISDKEDSAIIGFLDKINVLGVSSEENPGEFFQPYQAYIYNGEYPFCRNMHIINGEGRSGLGTGFAAFIAGEKGQLIILKAGMVPATQPVRMVTITN